MKGMMKPRTISNTDWEAPTSFHSWRKWRSLPPTDEATGGGMDDVSGASQFFLWPPFPPRDERPYPFPRLEAVEEDEGAEEDEAAAEAAAVARAGFFAARWRRR